MWPPKPDILISLELWQTGWQFQRQIWGFRPLPVRQNWPPSAMATTTNNWKLQYGRFTRQSRNFWQLVGRCRNDLANSLLSSTSSKIPNLAWELRRYLSQFQRCNYFRFGGHIDISDCQSLLYLLTNIILHVYIVLYPSVVGILTVPFVA